MSEISTELPIGWEITTVTITASTSYRVPVAHPAGASGQAIAVAGYSDYQAQTQPETVFGYELGEDVVTVAGTAHDTWGRPAWDQHRPDHHTVAAIARAHQASEYA